MKIPGNPMPSIQLGTSLSQDSIPSSSGGDGGGLQAMLSGAFEQCGIDQTTVQDYLGSVGIAKDSGMGMMSLKNAVSSFSSWMSSDSYINKDALMTLSHGLNGVAMLAKTGGGMLGGLGAYATGATSAFVNASKVYTGVQEGNLSQALFSGAKLCAAVALSGVPMAGAALTVAEIAYNRYYG
jgi:hypothetical protein